MNRSWVVLVVDGWKAAQLESKPHGRDFHANYSLICTDSLRLPAERGLLPLPASWKATFAPLDHALENSLSCLTLNESKGLV